MPVSARAGGGSAESPRRPRRKAPRNLRGARDARPLLIPVAPIIGNRVDDSTEF